MYLSVKDRFSYRSRSSEINCRFVGENYLQLLYLIFRTDIHTSRERTKMDSFWVENFFDIMYF